MRIPVTLAAFSLAGCAAVQEPPLEHHVPITIEHGRVVAVEHVQRPSSAPGGALVGGLLGLALSGDGAAEKLVGAVAGAAVGGTVTAAAEGPLTGWAYTVALRGGRAVRIVTEYGDLREGDCVALEHGRWANLRRVSPALCEPPPPPSYAERDLAARERRGAEQCALAKEELVRAHTREEVDVAVRKVRVLCGN